MKRTCQGCDGSGKLLGNVRCPTCDGFGVELLVYEPTSTAPPDPRDATIARLTRERDEARARLDAQVTPAGVRTSLLVAKHLLTAFYLYPNYRVDSRGPRGCIIDALAEVAPGLAEMIRDGEPPGKVLHMTFPEAFGETTKGDDHA